MHVTGEDWLIGEALRSPVSGRVLQRVLRQLIESLIYEGVIAVEAATTGEAAAASATTAACGQAQLFTLRGHDERGAAVAYSCRGSRRLTFGRIRLDDAPVLRTGGGRTEPANDLAQFVREVLGDLDADPGKLRAFTEELEQTLLKDTLVQFERELAGGELRGRPYDELESALMDGHPYHPCYKSRIGFDFADHLAYGPEFAPAVRLVWLAVHRSRTLVTVDPDYGGYDEVLAAELGEPQLARFRAAVREAGAEPDDYVFVPAHPWQWRKAIATSFVQDQRTKQVLLVGQGRDDYRPLQSIRTLANRSQARKANVKLPLQLLNTSSPRHLLPHFVVTAPPITRWLKQLAANDPYLKKEARLILLGEYAGVSYAAPDSVGKPISCGAASAAAEGALGCIWRESIHGYLEDGEAAVPFNALCARELDGSLFIEPWLVAIGVETWLKRLFKTCVLPIVHLLAAHGVALEAHAQNMVLVHRSGMPFRVALKDFHEDVLFYRPYLAEPELCPDFAALHPIYRNAAPNAFFETDSPEPVRGLTLGALFFINLGELALALADRMSYPEEQFWQLAAEMLERHQSRFPELAERFALFDLFVATTRVEQLTKRRLYAKTESLLHDVPNPLHAARARLLGAAAGR
ncbi:siderophore biosynthesis protein [Paenibacillus athensensis]|uniref:Siderophore biosynthesis protein n=1 Tax=Paenibacillus athensensis TaxID=1967502 RepID=A0A4Y8Q3M7_9BACL|nr:IucA/IucC family protein [Paenibacillus athensensis]MCD1258408.1 siderophore biosynthesis protein [Paenibacillus athensensis]